MACKSHQVEMRRAGAIIAVLMLLVMGIIIAATVLETAAAARATSYAEAQRAQSRALGWSGIQALMAELSEQRENLLDGQPPNITPEWELFTLDDGTRGVVRLIDLDPESMVSITPESAKLDINTATAEMLGLILGLNKAIAEAIVEARTANPFTSVEQLLGIEGITPELLYGSATDSQQLLPVEAESPGLLQTTANGRGLQQVLTVFSFDPNVQVGFDGDTESRGNLRVNLDQSWSDELDRAIADRFDQETANMVKAIMEAGQTFATDSDLVGVLATNGVPVEQWAPVLDVFTTTDDQFLLGRVDVNTAPPEVLACIPGISPAQAETIVTTREGLDSEMRRSPTWLAVEGILTPEEYTSAADWVTTRSMQWRAWIEVGFEMGDPLGGFDDAVPMTLDQLLESWDEQAPVSQLTHRMILEAVIDLGSTRPRVAYLREVTMFDPVYAMQLAISEAEEEDRLLDPFDGLPDLDAIDDPALSELSDEDLFLSGLDDFGFGDPLDDALDEQADEGGVLVDEGNEIDTSSLPGESTREPPDMIDRRIGRWSTRKAGES